MEHIKSKGLLDTGYYAKSEEQERKHREEKKQSRHQEIAESISAYEPSEIDFSLEAVDADTVIGLVSLDQLIYNDLYEHEFPKVVGYIRRKGGSIDDAKDVFQDALVIFIEKIHQKNLKLTCSIGTYLHAISKTLWKNHFRISAKEKDAAEGFWVDVDHEDFFFLTSEPDIYEQVSKIVDQMGDSCKKLIESYYYKRQNWDSIAISLGYKDAAFARNQKYKCLEKIRSRIKMRPS